MDLRSKLGIGTVQFGLPYGISNVQGQTLPGEIEKILRLACDMGIDLLDTASAYGNAQALLGNTDLASFKIVSKFLPPDRDNTLGNRLKQTLRELKVKGLYGYLAHRPLSLLDNPHWWEEILEMKKTGLISKVGFSLNRPGELDELTAMGFFPDLVQVPFNYFDQRFKEHMVRLKDHGCEIHARSVFLQGLFFTEPDKLPSFFAEVRSRIISLQSSTKYLSGALLKYVLQNPLIDRVIIGVENADQLLANLEMLDHADDLPLPDFTVSEDILTPSNWPQIKTT